MLPEQTTLPRRRERIPEPPCHHALAHEPGLERAQNDVAVAVDEILGSWLSQHRPQR